MIAYPEEFCVIPRGHAHRIIEMMAPHTHCFVRDIHYRTFQAAAFAVGRRCSIAAVWRKGMWMKQLTMLT